MPPVDAAYLSASVFLLIFGNEEPCFLAIQKADNEGYPWRNQIALPGGHAEKNDKTRIDTAYRELEEELEITRNQVEFIGSIGHFQTISNIDLAVYLGCWNENGGVRYDPKEISRVLKIPLKTIITTHMEKKFHGRLPDVDELEYPFKDIVIWGVTGKIIHYFIELIYPLIDNNKNIQDNPEI